MPKSRRVQKGVLSPNRMQLTPKQRQEFIRLRAEGIDEETAHELALVIQKGRRSGWLSGILESKLPDDLKLAHVAKAGWSEADHPRDKDGKFGEGSGGGDKPKKELDPRDLMHGATPFASQNSREHLAEAKKSIEKASNAVKNGNQEHYDHHTAVADAHLKAYQAARDDADKRPVKDGEVRAAHSALLNEYMSGGREGQQKLLAGYRPALRDALDGLNRNTGRIERREKAKKIDWAAKAVQLEREASKTAYSNQFVRSAAAMLPKEDYAAVHQHARSSAGGQSSGVVRRHAAHPDQARDDLVARREALHAEILEIDEKLKDLSVPVAKAITPEGEIHVDVPLGDTGPAKRKKPKGVKQIGKKPAKEIKLNDDGNVSKSIRLDRSLDLARSAQVEPELGPTDRMKDAQRLVAGMDWEMLSGAANAQEARARASRNLNRAIGHYDNVLQRDDDLRAIQGVDIDLGSGQVRTLGAIGLDLYPYDYGTAVWDLSMALPFGDCEVRSVKLVNTLQYLADYRDNALPLLMQIQRVMNYGGRLLYVGNRDLTTLADWDMLPGLVLIDHEDSSPLEQAHDEGPATLFKQTFERVRARVPRIYGADPEWLGVTEEEPDDLAYAREALGSAAQADETMAQLFKSTGDMDMEMDAPIMPTQKVAKKWQQIIHAVVTSPSELDYDGEYMSAEAIEKMAHDAFRDRIPIKSEHVGDPLGAQLVESYITPQDMSIKGAEGPQHIPKGSWVVGIHIQDDKEWQKVLNGEYRGISVGGRALIEQR